MQNRAVVRIAFVRSVRMDKSWERAAARFDRAQHRASSEVCEVAVTGPARFRG